MHSDKRTMLRPIWEMELIISGAIIIGLFQLPQMADQTFDKLLPHLSKQSFILPFMIYYLCKLSINGLIGAFMLHFTVRSLWVAVLGLKEVFPESVDPDTTDHGPMYIKFLHTSKQDLDQLRLKLDHFASLIFSVLFMLIVIMAMLGFYVGLSAILARGLSALGIPGQFSTLFLTIFGIIYGSASLFSVLGSTIDAWFKKDPGRADSHPGLAKLVFRCHQVTYYAFFNFLIQPIAVVLRTRVSGPQFVAAGFGLTLVLIIPFFIGIKLKTSEFDSYIYLPAQSVPQLLTPAHYDSLRRPDDDVNVPSIQSDIIKAAEEPIKLFIPFFALRNNQLIEELCPDLEPFHNDGMYTLKPLWDTPVEDRREKANKALHCFEQLFELSLDGNGLKPDRFLFTRHHLTDKGGVVMYLPTDSLSPGNHTLHLSMKYLSKKGKKDFDVFIPFWLEKEETKKQTLQE